MRRLVISLLGTFTVELDGEPVTEFGYDKVRALLAYLAVEGRRPQRRDTLVALLWPDKPQGEALNNLRTALFHLRRALGDHDSALPFLLVTRDALQLNSDATVEVDALRFAQLASDSRQHPHPSGEASPDCVRAMDEASALYRGDLLPGFAPDCAPFEEWLLLQREALHEQALGLLDRLAAHEEARGAYDQVLTHARRRIQLEPWHEPAHRQAMRALVFSGQRAAAVAQFDACREVLDRELGVKPEPATLALQEQILSGELLRPPEAHDLTPERERHRAGPCPYRGLAAFREADAALFFGRDAFVDRLFRAVTGPSAITVVVGPSGSGKSSVVFAGLLPRLRDRGGWAVVSFRPGRQPFQALAAALTPAFTADTGEAGRRARAGTLAHELETGRIRLRELAHRAHPTRLLLLLDQAEELYTLCTSQDTRLRFVDTLLEAVQNPEDAGQGPGPLALLLTLRADFIGQALAHRPLANALQTATHMLGPMTRDELREAIEKPAAAHGAVFEAGLVSRLLNDVALAPGGLPLLEFALTLLWRRLDRGWLTHTAYDAIGQVQGALARYAQEVYERLSTEEQAVARRVFTQLVQPGEGTEDTRRVATRADVGDRAWALAQHLASQRLVVTARDETTGAETVEVVHEALIRSWGQLQAWMVEDRAFRTWQERLRAGLHTWENTGHDEGALLRGVPLAEAEEWLRVRGDSLNETECTFVSEGLALRGRRVAEREAQRQAELEAQRQLREAHDVALRQAAIGLAAEARNQMQGPGQDLAVLLALEAVEHFPYTWQTELALAEIVLTWRLVWQFPHGVPVYTAPHVSPDGTKLLTASSDGMVRVWDLSSGANLLTVQAYQGTAATLQQWAHWSPSGDRILTHSVTGAIPRVWEATSGELLAECAVGGGRFAAWSPDGTRILSYWGQQDAAIWDARTGDKLLTIPGSSRRVVGLSPDGRWVATNLGQVWDIETGELYGTLQGFYSSSPGDITLPLTWSPDGKAIGAGIDGTARIWDVATGEEILGIHTRQPGMAKLWWSPSGDRLLSMATDAEAAIVWDAATGVELARFPHSGGAFLQRDPWSADGERILLPDSQGHITLWEAATGGRLLDLPAHAGMARTHWLPDGSGFVTTSTIDDLARVWRIATPGFGLDCQRDRPPNPWQICDIAAWSPDGTRVARPLDDGSVHVWDVVSRAELRRIRHVSRTEFPAVNFLAWSPDAERILTGAVDGAVEIWDSANGERLLALAGHGDAALDPVFTLDHVVIGLAWSPDGRRVLSCARDRRAVVWDTGTGDALRVFTGQEFFWGTWSPDGQRIVLVDQFSGAGPVRIWDSHTGRALLTLLPDDLGHGTSAVAWSPDGTRIVTFSRDGVGRLWDAQIGALRATFAAEAFSGVAQWSPSGERFLVGGSPSGVRVWDAATLEMVARYPAVPGSSAGSWSPDGKAIAIGYANGDTRVYPAWQSLEELIAYARAHCVLRELTPEERARYGLATR